MGNIDIGYLAIDSQIWEVQRYLMRKYGVDASDRETAPLKWWINTGRASTGFLRAFMEAKPFMIARQLHKGGSDQDVINRIISYLNLERGNI